jgi:hypothetical protein
LKTIRRPKYPGHKFNRKELAMLRKYGVTTLMLLSLTALSACGDTPGQRALSGGAIGAGSGAIIGAATGGSAATGALIGGGIGAIGGAVTNRNQVNLGN